MQTEFEMDSRITVPHQCIQCDTAGTEAEMIHLSPKGLSKKDIERLPTRLLGLWIHERCYVDFFKTHSHLNEKR